MWTMDVYYGAAGQEEKRKIQRRFVDVVKEKQKDDMTELEIR